MPHSDQRCIRVSMPSLGLSVTVDLLLEQNPQSCEVVWQSLPITSTFGHVVVSGGGLWIPTTIVHTGETRAAERSIGSVYLNSPMQTISMTYGAISESATVNEFGRVAHHDLGTLKQMGELVWENTVLAARKVLIQAHVERVEG